MSSRYRMVAALCKYMNECIHSLAERVNFLYNKWDKYLLGTFNIIHLYRYIKIVNSRSQHSIIIQPYQPYINNIFYTIYIRG
jgi:hypothetical protein